MVAADRCTTPRMTGPEGRQGRQSARDRPSDPGPWVARTDKRFRGSSAMAHDWPSQDHGFGLYISNKPQAPVMGPIGLESTPNVQSTEATGPRTTRDPDQKAKWNF